MAVSPMDASGDGETKNLLENVPEDSSDFLPEKALMERETRDLLINVLGELPDEEKTSTSLRYMGGMSVVEIAQALKKSPHTVKAQIYSAKKKLQKAIGAPEQFYALAGLPVLTKIFEQEIQSGGYMLSVAALESLYAQAVTEATTTVATTAAGATEAATAATAATEASTAATTAAGTSAASTITTGAGILGKIAALTTGTKAALAVAAAVVVVGGGGAAYVQHENAVKQAEAAAIIQQQEEQARLDAEQAARAAAEQRAKEEEAARKAEAERIAAEQAKAEETARQAEAERIAAEEAEAEETARQAEAERIAAEEAEAKAEAQEAEKTAAQSTNQSTIETQQKDVEEQVSAPVETVGQKDTGEKASGTVQNTGMTMEQLIAARKNAGVTTYREGGGDLLGRPGSMDNIMGDWSGQQEPAGTPASEYKPVKDGTAKWQVPLGGWLYVKFSEIRLITPAFEEYVIGYTTGNPLDGAGLPGQVGGEPLIEGEPESYWKEKNGTVYDPVFKKELTRGTEEFIYGSFVGQDEPTFYCKGKEIADRVKMSWDSSLGGWVDTKHDHGEYDDWISVIFPDGNGANHYPNR